MPALISRIMCIHRDSMRVMRARCLPSMVATSPIQMDFRKMHHMIEQQMKPETWYFHVVCAAESDNITSYLLFLKFNQSFS